MKDSLINSEPFFG